MSADAEHHRKLERMYAAAPCHHQVAPDLRIVDEGKTRVELEAVESLHHAAGAVHGSYYFKLLDDAAFFAANSVVPDVFVLTASFNIQLLRPVAAGPMIAEGHVVRAGKQMIFADSILRNADGVELARGTGVFARSRVELATVPSYA